MFKVFPQYIVFCDFTYLIVFWLGAVEAKKGFAKSQAKLQLNLAFNFLRILGLGVGLPLNKGKRNDVRANRT